MRQLDLYHEPAISRRTDPVTSHEAGDEIKPKLGLLHQRCLDALGTDQLTAAELAQRCASAYGGMAESYRKRMKELVRAGEIVELAARTCTVSGKNATVYRRASQP
jgi:hypothetical protein